MLLKYIDLHNKTLRDAKDPMVTAQKLIDNGYFIVGVTVHNDENEIKGKEHFYRLFEEYFEKFHDLGLLIFPAVELKIRKGNFEDFDKFVDQFTKKYIPVKIKGKTHHIPFIILVHGGKKEVNLAAVSNPKVDMICHPEKDEGYFPLKLAKIAAKNKVGVEINYREFQFSEDKEGHKSKVMKVISEAKKADMKLFLSSAVMHDDEIIHIRELLKYGHSMLPTLVDESTLNTYELVTEKYVDLLDSIDFSLELMQEKQGL